MLGRIARNAIDDVLNDWGSEIGANEGAVLMKGGLRLAEQANVVLDVHWERIPRHAAKVALPVAILSDCGICAKVASAAVASQWADVLPVEGVAGVVLLGWGDAVVCAHNSRDIALRQSVCRGV